jgi:hypothetical protein
LTYNIIVRQMLEITGKTAGFFLSGMCGSPESVREGANAARKKGRVRKRTSRQLLLRGNSFPATTTSLLN